MTTTLALDNAPGILSLGYVLGDPWTRSVDHKTDGALSPWPAAPVLEFDSEDVPNWIAVLTNTDSRATWIATEEQVAALHAAGSPRVRLVVAGVTWFAGQAVHRA